MNYSEIVSNLPIGSGIYLMFDKNYSIIYVGKAKNIKKRVTSYFQKEHFEEKTRKLVSNIEYIRWIVTKNEVEAFILENNLIKLHRPKYNILLKDAKGYPYIGITKEKFSRVTILRKISQINQKKYKIFGPYLGQIVSLIEELNNNYQIRTCNLAMQKVHLRPCIRYHLKKCLAPCVNKEVEASYQQNILEIQDILKGTKIKDLQIAIQEKMIASSSKELFEKALFYRDQLTLIEKISQTQAIESLRHFDSEDVWVFKRVASKIFFCVLEIRSGKVLHKYFDYHTVYLLENEAENETLLSLIFQYYQWRIPPKKLIVEEMIDSDVIHLTDYFKVQNVNVEVICPKIESYAKQLLLRGRENLEMEFLAHSRKIENQYKKLEFLKEKLKLKKIPNMVECFDISNIQGKDAVGSMSAARNGEITPENYRRFRIKTLDTPNDFAMLREVIFRRYSKLEFLPDLIVIDGGKGQLSSVSAVLDELKILEKVDLISLAKQEEEVFTLANCESIMLSKDSTELKFLQKLRDEAHRFGITYHRVVREKRILSSTLDEIPHVGPKIKKKLLEKFKTIENIRMTSELELRKVVSERVSKAIIKYYTKI
ncbi:MAG: excinuclease ABC subunit UvrC [Fusobacteria bacterium]|nr:excinuclease ABC subunit UvrC [Fusobacteriota bacterium]